MLGYVAPIQNQVYLDDYETSANLPADDIAEDLVHTIGDTIGYWWILGLALFGAVYFFRKKVKSWLKNLLSD